MNFSVLCQVTARVKVRCASYCVKGRAQKQKQNLRGTVVTMQHQYFIFKYYDYGQYQCMVTPLLWWCSIFWVLFVFAQRRKARNLTSLISS